MYIPKVNVRKYLSGRHGKSTRTLSALILAILTAIILLVPLIKRYFKRFIVILERLRMRLAIVSSIEEFFPKEV